MELACLRISCITKQEALCLGWHMDSHQWVSMPRINLFQQVALAWIHPTDPCACRWENLFRVVLPTVGFCLQGWGA